MPLSQYQEPAGHRDWLAALLGEREFVYAVFSHGPWFGFDGIQAICVLPDRFVVVQDGVAWTRGQIVHDLPLMQVADVRTRVRARPLLSTMRFSARLAGRPVTYVSKYQNALTVVDVLRASRRGPIDENEDGLSSGEEQESTPPW